MENKSSDSLMSEQHNVINMLEQSELEVARMYEMFAKWFPEQVNFWMARAREERDHAGIIRTFGRKLQTDGCDMGGHEFKVVEIRHWLKKIQNYMRNFDGQDHNLGVAYSLAVEMEQGLLEHHLFGVDACGSAELRAMLDKLQADTVTHLEIFEKQLQGISG
ncbi:MAG: hypothetical protein WC889_19590 [Myxococcota bacterium]|jgi:hypothetical protein